MKDGFIKVATMTPDLRVADIAYNVGEIIKGIEKAHAENVSLLVFPELAVTGYTCGDLFNHRSFIDAAMKGVEDIVKATEGKKMLTFVGAPIRNAGKLYDCAVAIFDGKILGIVPKTHLANYGESYEARSFMQAPATTEWMLSDDEGNGFFFGAKQLFEMKGMEDLTVACEIGEDLWTINPPSLSHAAAGATVIVNLSASAEIVGRAEKRRELVRSQSAKICGAYIYANAGSGESTTDGVFSGHSIIAENGKLLSERKPFDEGMQTAIIDISALADERAMKNTFPCVESDGSYVCYSFEPTLQETDTPKVAKRPFIPENEAEFAERAESILNIQTYGLKKRLAHAHAKTAVIGISGGLDPMKSDGC